MPPLQFPILESIRELGQLWEPTPEVSAYWIDKMTSEFKERCLINFDIANPVVKFMSKKWKVIDAVHFIAGSFAGGEDPTRAQLELPMRLMSFILYIDDIMSDESPFAGQVDIATKFMDILEAIMMSATDILECETKIVGLLPVPLPQLVRFWADLWPTMGQGRSDHWIARNRELYRKYLYYHKIEAQQQQDKTAFHCSEDFYEYRRNSSGILWSITLNEVIYNYECPQLAYDTLVMKQLMVDAANFVFVTNEIISYEKEVAQGEVERNLLYIRARDEARSIDEVVAIIHGELEEYIARLQYTLDSLDQIFKGCGLSEDELGQAQRFVKHHDSPYHLEAKLSKLEGQASEIFHRACEEFSKGSILELKRAEVNHSRKFLILMKCRNTGMFDRYNRDHVDNYDADDRERMLEYMASNGLSKPRDV
ncbi:hypothetical protein BBP40_002910 [Aspergillus hancockii]|nr:hypothetical protein BBP40_002910 [Aspergillus hancockii]